MLLICCYCCVAHIVISVVVYIILTDLVGRCTSALGTQSELISFFLDLDEICYPLLIFSI